MSGGASPWLPLWGLAPSYPARIPPPLGRAPRAVKGGLGSVFRSGTMKKKFSGKNSPTKASVPPTKSQNPRKNFREKLQPKLFPYRNFFIFVL